MSYVILWILISGIVSGVAFLLHWLKIIELPFSSIWIPLFGIVIASIAVANEMRIPKQKEYNRKKAMYPAIPEKYRHKKPISGSVVFGTDTKTKEIVMAEPGHHSLIVGSTGSGKTATCLIPAILSCTGGSKQIVDIKSRELAYKTADLEDEKTFILDINRKADYIYGWDIFYKLRRDGSATESEVLDVIREVAAVIVPKGNGGDAFWADSARNELIGLSIFEFCYAQTYEFIDIVKSILGTSLREHMEIALNTVRKDSLVSYYLTGLASTADETLFSINITLQQALYVYLQQDVVWFLKDNPKRIGPDLLNMEGVTQYLCVDEEKLDVGYDKVMAVVMKQTLMELQNRTTSGSFPETMLYWDEWQKLSESIEEIRQHTASFLKTARSKHVSCVLAAQNIDNFKKEVIYDIISNIHYFFVLSSNNANSLTSEVAVKMAGTYYEKTKNFSEGRGTSVSTSYTEKNILKPEDLNRLGEEAILIVANEGFFRTRKEGTAYYKVEPFRSQYERRIEKNKTIMTGV